MTTYTSVNAFPFREEKKLSEHLTQKQVEGYGRRALPVAELLSASDHLAGCESCRRQVEESLGADDAFFSMESGALGLAAEDRPAQMTPTHLTFDQTADYVDGILTGDELLLARDHLNSCGKCLLAVNDLRAFRDQVAPELGREYRPSSVQAKTEKPWRRFVAAFPTFSFKSPRLVFGSALASLLLIASAWLIWYSLREKAVKRETIVKVPPPTVSPTSIPTVGPKVAEPALIAQLNDGAGQVILDRDGKLTGLGNMAPDYHRMVKGALTDQRLEKSPLLAGLGQADRLSLRGGDNQGNEFSVISPVGKILPSDRPTFRWSRLEGVTAYIVEVYDDKFGLAATSPQLSGTSWTLPQSLKRGGVYSWQVKAIKDGQEFFSPRPPSPQAKFRVIDQAKANELAQARSAYASSHLTMALLYTQAGLLDEAEQELRALQKANPGSEIPRRLLANLQAMRR